jgi:F0F1-type ATP synthase membrane subunit c/vacuolar-type H+-ATPase subunit K
VDTGVFGGDVIGVGLAIGLGEGVGRVVGEAANDAVEALTRRRTAAQLQQLRFV